MGRRIYKTIRGASTERRKKSSERRQGRRGIGKKKNLGRGGKNSGAGRTDRDQSTVEEFFRWDFSKQGGNRQEKKNWPGARRKSNSSMGWVEGTGHRSRNLGKALQADWECSKNSATELEEKRIGVSSLSARKRNTGILVRGQAHRGSCPIHLKRKRRCGARRNEEGREQGAR